MSLGLPLNDFDRSGWLNELNKLLAKEKRVILACSALKRKYRETLNKDCNNIYVYLKGNYDTIHARMIKRSIKNNHFFNPSMLQSQFDTLEEPTDKELGENQLIVVSIDNDPVWIVEFILCKIKKYI
jgi:gluconokinase